MKNSLPMNFQFDFTLLDTIKKSLRSIKRSSETEFRK